MKRKTNEYNMQQQINMNHSKQMVFLYRFYTEHFFEFYF